MMSGSGLPATESNLSSKKSLLPAWDLHTNIIAGVLGAG